VRQLMMPRHWGPLQAAHTSTLASLSMAGVQCSHLVDYPQKLACGIWAEDAGLCGDMCTLCCRRLMRRSRW